MYKRHAELHAVKVVPVDAKRLEGMAGGGMRHQGVVARVSGESRHVTLDDVLDTLEEPAFLLILDGIPVSYTHLDVYKRQA